jgi:MOSC domain-containing protein YiiM
MVKAGRVFQGTVLFIYVAPQSSVPMESREEVTAIAGRGIDGDRYFHGVGHWSKSPGVSREITLIEIEAIEALNREKDIHLDLSATRRNVVTRGVSLNHLVGREFRVGCVRLLGTRLCEPCVYLEGLTQKGVLAGLTHRGGLRADIVAGGTIRVGDLVSPGGDERESIAQGRDASTLRDRPAEDPAAVRTTNVKAGIF